MAADERWLESTATGYQTGGCSLVAAAHLWRAPTSGGHSNYEPATSGVAATTSLQQLLFCGHYHSASLCIRQPPPSNAAGAVASAIGHQQCAGGTNRAGGARGQPPGLIYISTQYMLASCGTVAGINNLCHRARRAQLVVAGGLAPAPFNLPLNTGAKGQHPGRRRHPVMPQGQAYSTCCRRGSGAGAL